MSLRFAFSTLVFLVSCAVSGLAAESHALSLENTLGNVESANLSVLTSREFVVQGEENVDRKSVV